MPFCGPALVSRRASVRPQVVCRRILADGQSAMAPLAQSDQLLVNRIRAGEPDAWNELIARFEGRLLAFVEGRLGRRIGRRRRGAGDVFGLSEQPAQFRRLAAAGKLSVFDRGPQADRSLASRGPPAHAAPGRRLQRQRMGAPDRARAVSSVMRSGERRGLEEAAIVEALAEQIDRLRKPRASGRSSSASSCCSCAAGPIATWRCS